MRIGIMARAYDEKGGIGVYTRNIICELLAIDTLNEYFIYYKNPALLGSVQGYPNVTERYVPGKSKLYWDQIAIPRAARRDRVDLIFNTKFTVPLVTSAKRIMVVHGADTMMDEYAKEYRRRDVLYNRAVRPWYFRACARVLSISNYSTEGFVRAIPRYKDRLVTTYFGPHAAFHPIYDREKLEVIRRRYALPQKFILTVIRYDPGTPNTRKNAGNMLKAFALLKQQHRIEHKFVVVGKDCHRFGEDYRIDELGIADDVVFPGLVPQEDLPAFYNLASLYLYPTIIEAFPVPITEAMACGTPIVTSHGTGLEELAGDAALKVNPLNPAEIAEAAHRVLTEPVLARQLAERGFERSRLFSWEKCVRETLQVFEEVMASSKAAIGNGEVKLRICYLIETFWPIIGGGENGARLLCDQFAKQGVEVSVLTGHSLTETPQHETLFGANVHRIGPSGGTLRPRRWLMVLMTFYWLLKTRDRWDIVFVDGFRSLGFSSLLVAKCLRKKIVFKALNFGEMSGEFFDGGLRRIGLSHCHWLIRPLIAARNILFTKADFYCPNTSDIQEEFQKAGVPRAKIQLIYNPYDSVKFIPATSAEKMELRKKLCIAEDALVGIFTGRLVAWKGPHYLVRLWHEVAAQHEKSILLVVGPDGNEAANCADDIRSYIRERGLENKIRMTGGVRNVHDYLRASDYFAFPSQRGEGCSQATIEAMACGLPVVTTTATGIVDIVNEETALSVAPQDFVGFKDALVRIISDVNLREELGKAGAVRAKKFFASDIIASEYLNVMERLTECTPVTGPSAAPLVPAVSMAGAARRIVARSTQAGEQLFRVSLAAGALLAWLFAILLPAISIHILGSRLSSDHYALPAVGIFVLLMSITFPAQRLLFAAKQKDLQIKFVFTGVLMILALGVSLFHEFGINGILTAILAGAMVVVALSLRALSVRDLAPFLWRLGGPFLISLGAALSADMIIHHDSTRPAWAALGSLAAMCVVWLATNFIPPKHHQ